MKALVFAAGLGTRLSPLTDTMPKALVPVCGKPLVGHVVNILEAAGYDDITINAHHFAAQIKDYLSSTYADRFGDMPGRGVHCSDETDLLRDTGGGIAHARKYLDGDADFLVHNTDILSNLDLTAFRASRRADALATLVVSERESGRYFLFDDDMRLAGWTNVKTGEVKAARPGLEPENCRKLAFSGIHLISPKIFPLMSEPAVFHAESVPEKFSIIDFYLAVAGEHPIYGYVPEDFQMLDVGKADSLSQAERFVKTL